MKGANFWVIVFFAVINNGCSLLGHGEGSVGGVARSMEFKTEVAEAVEMQRSQKLNAGNPPPRHGEMISSIFQWDVVEGWSDRV
ncbi:MULTISPECIES: hypothetical protein [Pseudomonas]|uniref:Uncharacterized protein n=1 Tax=Pseudomonas lutea TaxID=243924 RepID=A0A9X0EC32_9PSED|nr:MULTISPECIES: hypothetical protein [Pseudomonas]KGF62981.1 hypothetical protein LT42_13585 [Pseudomonas lutea]MBD8122617.1 hypothetical protein [Pseudomonas lutea]